MSCWAVGWAVVLHAMDQERRGIDMALSGG
jgi:hypothetical protein